MSYFQITFQHHLLTQAQDGIFINNELFIPAVINSITPHYHFTSYSTYSKVYEIKLVETESCFPDKPLILYFDPGCPRKFLACLESYGLKSDFLLKDSIEIWNFIVSSKESGLLAERPLLNSDRSGWVFFEGDLYYMTSQFAITKNGIIPEYHCINANACLFYDKDMEESEAFLETMEFIDLDFDEVMPIVITQILSVLQPVVETMKLYGIPGLFLSGPTSSGKTELALAFGTLFGNFATKDLQNFLILQSGPKDFKLRQSYFSDTTFILDDARKSPAYSVCQSITGLIDRFGRSTFGKDGIRLTPIITGEPQVLNKHLESLRNRFIEIYLNPSRIEMNCRRRLIGKIKENPLPLRTCILYFIKFICKIVHSSQPARELKRIKEEFKSAFEEQVYRGQDNIFMHYFAFSLFLSYGQSVGCITREERIHLIDRYKKVLLDSCQNSNLYTKEGQIKTFIHFLCNSIKSGHLKIYTPEIQTCYYPGRYRNDEGYQTNSSYGHFSVIDIEYGFSGVYIKKRAALPGFNPQIEDLPVLIINSRRFFEFLSYEKDEFERRHGYRTLDLTESQLKKLLADNGLLYIERRYEKNNEKEYYNYCCNYPHSTNIGLKCQSVFCINMKSPYAQEIAKCIDSISPGRVTKECVYYNENSPFSIDSLSGDFEHIKSFKHYKK